MVERIREIWEQLSVSIYQGGRLKENLRTIAYMGGIISLISGVMTVMNLWQGRYRVAMMTVVIFLFGIAIIMCASLWKSRRAVHIVTLLLCILPFTDFAVRGVNEGFAILWTLLIPLAVSYFLSVRTGLLLGVYYEILTVVLFYTPLREGMTGLYAEVFMQRYPLLYLCDLLLTAVSMIPYHMQMLEQIRYEERLQEEVEKQTRSARESLERLEHLSIHMVQALTNAIDAKDEYTNGHSVRVSQYSMQLAEALGWDKAEIEDLGKEALLHDVGKIGIPDVILNKPGRLEDDEFLAIKGHTIMGAKILEGVTELPQAMLVARHHHERYDGMGYPDRLSGTDIPAHARVVAIADAYDAMHSDRIYRKGLTEEEIRSELRWCRGKQFDPEYIDVFLKLFDSGELQPPDGGGITGTDLQDIDPMP